MNEQQRNPQDPDERPAATPGGADGSGAAHPVGGPGGGGADAAAARPAGPGAESADAARGGAAADAPGAGEADEVLRTRARSALLKYGGLRLLLFVVLTAVIQVLALLIGAPVPLVMSALLALLVAFPLSMLVFPRQRVEATEAVGVWQARRKERKQWIRDELAER